MISSKSRSCGGESNRKHAYKRRWRKCETNWPKCIYSTTTDSNLDSSEDKSICMNFTLPGCGIIQGIKGIKSSHQLQNLFPSSSTNQLAGPPPPPPKTFPPPTTSTAQNRRSVMAPAHWPERKTPRSRICRRESLQWMQWLPPEKITLIISQF